jgi:hypothetical protein
VVWGGHEDDIEFLGVFVEHLPPVGVALGFLPAFFVEDAIPRLLVDLSEGDALEAEAVGGTGVGTGTAADSDESALEFLILPLGADDARECERGGGEAAVLYKVTP